MEATVRGALIRQEDGIGEPDLAETIAASADHLEALVVNVEFRAGETRRDKNLSSSGAAERIADIERTARTTVEAITKSATEPLETELHRLEPSTWALLYSGRGAPNVDEKARWPEIRSDIRRAYDREKHPELWIPTRVREAVEANETDFIAAVLDWGPMASTFGITDELLGDLREWLFTSKRPDDVRRRNQLRAAMAILKGNGGRARSAVVEAGGVAIGDGVSAAGK